MLFVCCFFFALNQNPFPAKFSDMFFPLKIKKNNNFYIALTTPIACGATEQITFI